MFIHLPFLCDLTSPIIHEKLISFINRNHPTALIFHSFDQAKEQRFHFKRDFHLFALPKKVEPNPESFREQR
jgi:hypothetical protein